MNVIDESLWTQIKKPLGEELYAKHIFFELSDKIFIALDQLGFRHILIESGNEIRTLPGVQFRGVQVSIRELVISGGLVRVYIDLLCREPAGYHIFNSIGGEIAQKVSEMSQDSDLIEVITVILKKWKHFWGSYTQDVLSVEEQTGLFGELFFMRFWLLPKYGKNIISVWQGPNGERHDFILGDKSFEVKTSASFKGHIHKINGIDQLDDPEVGNLYLLSLWIRPNEQSEHSLISIIDSCRDYLESDESILTTFELLLSKSGYSESQREEYEKRRFEMIESAFFLVDQYFPRITQQSFSVRFPDQIEQLDYSINLNGYLNKSLCSSGKMFQSLEI